MSDSSPDEILAPEGSGACDVGNEYDGRLGLRISAIFVILVGSLLGTMVPILLARTARLPFPRALFFLAKFFGSGVIIATAFIHLLAPAVEALGSPCLGEDSIYAEYPWPMGIALMTVFTMFFVELLASRFDLTGTRRAGAVLGGAKTHDPALDLIKSSWKEDEEMAPQTNFAPNATDHSATEGPAALARNTPPPPPKRQVEDDQVAFSADAFAMQMTALFILEFGVVFHSIFIGLTLAVSGDEFVILYVVLVFHQTFEGLGLGSRLATAMWPPRQAWLPYVLGCAYALSTPVSIAAGLGVRETLEPGSPTTLVINGVFDSISAGILLYTGLVELMAHEFLFSHEIRRSSLGVMLSAFGCMVLGAGLMALLGKWA
ncbi:Zinc/iron permease [Cercophora newfieldiana]|uniref:Zinc/iron permease n=1 Tax=Cercophora newfieldiana TaxID=92897 RepID=A0AA39YTX4_9PEZI|nr:Zinc/iron permease [Cercophora newfieldiana]